MGAGPPILARRFLQKFGLVPASRDHLTFTMPAYPRMLRSRIPQFYALIAVSLVLSIRAAEPIDLNRTEPVAADQPVPIQDFFRPLVLQQPKINLTGTHIAALVSAAEDKHTLMVYELATQKVDRTGGAGDKDIYDFHWLNERRLIFSLSARKLYGLGLFAVDVNDLSQPYTLLQYYGSSLVAIPPKDRLRPLVWNRSDFETGKDLGVARINTDVRSG